MNVRFSDSARAKYLDILGFIRSRNAAAAGKLRRRTEQALKRLEQFPESGGLIEEYPDLPYREVLVAPCRFFYSIQGDTVRIFDVWHTSQVPDEPTG